MNAYVFQASLLCEDCAKEYRRRLDSAHITSPYPLCRHGVAKVHCEDSDCYPQGPYPNGGGESDSPQHCDRCHVFLENPLTEDGEIYVKGMFLYPSPTEKWDRTIKEWREFYAYLFTTDEEES